SPRVVMLHIDMGPPGVAVQNAAVDERGPAIHMAITIHVTSAVKCAAPEGGSVSSARTMGGTHQDDDLASGAGAAGTGENADVLAGVDGLERGARATQAVDASAQTRETGSGIDRKGHRPRAAAEAVAAQRGPRGNAAAPRVTVMVSAANLDPACAAIRPVAVD